MFSSLPYWFGWLESVIMMCFILGDAWLEAHAEARQAVTGPVFLVHSMFMLQV